MVFWDNEDFVAPAPVVNASKAKPKTAKELLQIADKAQSRSVDRGIQNDDPNRMARIGDPDTSVAAAKRAALSSGSQKAQLLVQYGLHEDLTDEEAVYHAGMNSGEGVHSRTQRCSSLRVDGYIIDTGRTRQGANGNQRMICAITQRGIEAIGSLNLVSSS